MHKSNIPSIIQDFAKRINSSITVFHILSLLVTCLSIFGLSLYIQGQKSHQGTPFTYTEGKYRDNDSTVSQGQLFASKNGKTYTYAWCSGASRILDKNKIFFANEQDAEKTGRTLSKNCNR